MNESLVVAVRAVIAFFSLLIFTRLLGKQQISQLNFFDYVLGITIGSIAATLTTDLSTRPWPQLVGLMVWTGAVLAMELITMKWRFAAKYIDGEPTILIMNGKIMEDAMRKLRYRASNLMGELRVNGVFDLNQVAFAVLETNGQLSVLKKSECQPLTPRDMDMTTSPDGMSIEVIYDGIVVEQNLKQANVNRRWLDAQLKARKINSSSEVFLATVDASGNLYVDTYQDRLKQMVDISDFPGPH
ncbi:MAG: DUF421 domain-containing protein [Bacillota bacterium]